MSVLEMGISRGNIYSLKSVWTYFCRKLQSEFHLDPGTYRSNKLKKKIQDSLGDKVAFVQPLNPAEPLLVISSSLGDAALHSLLQNPEYNQAPYEDDLSHDAIEDVDLDAELLSWLFRVAVKVHHDIEVTPGHHSVGGINMKNAEKVVPESLYMLIRLLCAGGVTDDSQADIEDGDIKKRVLSICQDIVFLVSKGRKLTPKHVGLGLTVHQATRSRELIQLLHSAGHTVSYDTVLRIDSTIANDVLKKYYDNGKVFVPRNFTDCSDQNYARYAADNIDINEETLTGMGTFHATQIAALRRKNEEEPKVDIEVAPNSNRKLNLEIPSELHELQHVDIGNEKPEPVMQAPVDEKWYEPNKKLIDKAFKKDLAWILSRLVKQQPEVQCVSGWSGFNQMLSSNVQQRTIVGPLPIVNAVAHDFETLWTVILKCHAITTLTHGRYSVITQNEALYNKAKMLQWNKTEECKNVVIMLGGFHTQMTFSKVIGKYMESSGLSDIWVESEVFGETTATNVLKGKIWNRVIRAHKLSYEALWRVLWPFFVLWAGENGKDVDGSLLKAQELADGFSSGQKESRNEAYESLMESLKQVPALVDEFDAAHSNNATFCYWRNYMHLVAILLRFTRALREGDWELFLSSFADMLPWFAAYDHVNYTRWGAVFLADMKLLHQVAPDVLHGFRNGDFVSKETSNQFNQIPDDQALEHVNRAGKSAGGLVGITRTDTARDRWCLTYHERAQLSEDTKVMFDVSSEADDSEEHGHKDTGQSRMRRDEEDVTKLVAEFQRYKVFRLTSDLIAVTTGDVASAEIKHDLLQAQAIGKTTMKELIHDRFITKKTKLHQAIKQQQLKTFETLYSVPVKTGQDKTVSIKADRNLFRRVIVALESGRDVDVDLLLERELSPVPLSLATMDGKLRSASNKADLSHILQENIVQSRAPLNQSETCTIIDGMAAVQSIGNRTGAKIFGEWCDAFLKFVVSHFCNSCSRVDVVFDRYQENSIKAGTRAKRKSGKEKGIKRNVESREQKIG